MATSTESNEPVVFLLPDGTEVSNDPRFYEKKMRDQLLEQQRQLLANVSDNTGKATGPAPRGSDTTTFTGQDIQESPKGEPAPTRGLATQPGEQSTEKVTGDDLDELNGDQLKAQAKLRDGIDLSGVKRVADLREVIKKHDQNQSS